MTGPRTPEGTKRVLIAVTIPAYLHPDDLATGFPPEVGEDATVWEWEDFWLDAAEDVAGPEHDTTAKETGP